LMSVCSIAVAEGAVFLESRVGPVAVVDADAVAAVVAALLQLHVVVNLELRPGSVGLLP